MKRLLSMAVAAVAVLGGRGAPADPAPAGVQVLSLDSYWRLCATLRPPRDAAGQLPAGFGALRNGKRWLPEDQPSSPAPPAGWTDVAFDDSAWWRRRGPLYPRSGDGAAVCTVCLRGKFTVNDPAAVKGLTLALGFRGGAAVYLNGREVARAFLPAGPLELGTLAEDYSISPPDRKKLSCGESMKAAAAYEQALIRRAADISIPPDVLRKGTNVLAIEVHRTARLIPGLTEADLRASGPADAVIANVSRPAGVQVWNANPLEELGSGSYGEPHEALRPIRIVAARNGTFSGQVVVSAAGPLEVRARVGALTLKGGAGAIPAEAVRVRYRLGPLSGYHTNGGGLSEAASAKAPEPSARGRAAPAAVVPVWLTVRVPRDAKGGEYEGTLAVEAAGAARDVPVRLTVADHTLPDPKDYVTWTDFIQSPDTLALTYGVPLYSDEHFALIERSLRLLAEAGNKVLYVPVVCGTHFGNEQGMVRWVRQADGTYRHDYAVMERYLDIALKTMKPQVVCLYVWDWYLGAVTRSNPGTGARVSLLDPASGQVTTLTGPRYLDPEAKGFLRPVAEGIRRRLRDRGLEKAMMIGIHGGAPVPTREAVMFLKEVFPGTPWVFQDHGHAKSVYGEPIGYLLIAYSPGSGCDPSHSRWHGWQNPQTVGEYIRDIRINQLPRLWAEWCLQGDLRGFGRIAGDFWPVPALKGHTVVDRFGSQGWSNLTLMGYIAGYLAPGPDGPLSTADFEMIREGVQECEARISIERALLDEKARFTLGEELATRAQAVLDERQRYNLWTGKGVYCGNERTGLGAGGRLGMAWYAYSGWQARSEKLFSAAGEVAAAAAVGRAVSGSPPSSPQGADPR